jgi:hypothetical protein
MVRYYKRLVILGVCGSLVVLPALGREDRAAAVGSTGQRGSPLTQQQVSALLRRLKELRERIDGLRLTLIERLGRLSSGPRLYVYTYSAAGGSQELRAWRVRHGADGGADVLFAARSPSEFLGAKCLREIERLTRSELPASITRADGLQESIWFPKKYPLGGTTGKYRNFGWLRMDMERKSLHEKMPLYFMSLGLSDRRDWEWATSDLKVGRGRLYDGGDLLRLIFNTKPSLAGGQRCFAVDRNFKPDGLIHEFTVGYPMEAVEVDIADGKGRRETRGPSLNYENASGRGAGYAVNCGAQLKTESEEDLAGREPMSGPAQAWTLALVDRLSSVAVEELRDPRRPPSGFNLPLVEIYDRLTDEQRFIMDLHQVPGPSGQGGKRVWGDRYQLVLLALLSLCGVSGVLYWRWRRASA